VKLIVGLGNSGARYEETRHNVGFKVLDRLAKRHASEVEWGVKNSLSLSADWKSQDTRFLWPQTMMNRSGEALQDVLQDWDVKPSDMLIVCDDVNLPLGTLRLRASGGPGGHHGLESCLAQLGTEDVPRLRIGVGRASMPRDLDGFVLSPFDREERPQVDEALARAVEACEVWIEEGIHAAMNRTNQAPKQEGTA